MRPRTILVALATVASLAGSAAYALDIRGQGKSGMKGTIAYIGQLDDDLEYFMRRISPLRPSTLVGFSSGGGFGLNLLPRGH